jgi:cytochrome c biogenesis protein CcdA
MTPARLLGAAIPLLLLTAALSLAAYAAAHRTACGFARRLRRRAEILERLSGNPDFIAGLRSAADVIDPPRHP